MEDFIFLLKDTGGQGIKLTLRDFHTAGIDFVQACIDTREQRQAHCAAWLEGGPQVMVQHLVFDRQGVQRGSARTPWAALDRVEIRTVESLGTTSYFHFHPAAGSGGKKFFQGMPPDKIEECLAEIDFWRSHCLPSGFPVAESRGVFEHPSRPHPAGGAKRLLWMALLAALLFGLLVCALIFSARPAGAQQGSAGGETWQAFPLSGGEITAIVADPFSAQVIFAGTRDGGVFQTTDAGLTWRPARAGLTYYPIRTLSADPVHPGTLYAGTDYDGVWKTTDGGASWVPASAGLDKSLIVFGLVFDPQDPSKLYAGLAGGVGLVAGNVYRSQDGGATWQMMDQGMPRESNSQHTNGVFALAADPAHPGWVYAGTNDQGVYRSTNGGATWALVNEGLPQRPGLSEYFQPINALAFDPHHNHRLVGIVGGEYYAFESGAWRKVSTGSVDCNSSIGVDRLYVHPTQPETLYSTGSTLNISLDGGQTWTQSLGWGNPGSGNIVQLAFHPSTPGVMYAASDILMRYEGGVWKTTDQGAHWSKSFTGITAQPVRSVAVDPTNPQRIYVGTGVSGFLYRSEDGGSTWSRGYEPGWTQGEETYNFGEVVDIAVDPLNPQKIYLAANDFYISTDGGVTFSKIDAVHSPGSIVLPEGAPGVIYVGSNFVGYGVYKSVDGGATWSQKNMGIPIFGNSLTPILSLAVDPSNPSTLWAGTQYGGGIVKTVDGGEHWVTKGLGENNFVEAIAVHPARSDTLLVGAGYSDGRIFRTTDGGNTWQTVLQGVGYVQDLLYDPRDPNWVYAITEGNGVLRSSNGGTTWFGYDPGIFYPVMYAADFTAGPSPRLIAGSYGSGLYWIDPDISQPLHHDLYLPITIR